MSERDLQRSVASLLDTLGLLWCHVPNERRNAAECKRLSGEGVKSGVPDVIIFESPKCYSCDPETRTLCSIGRTPHDAVGVAIELKFGRNTAKAAQKRWLAEMAKRGWRVSVCRTMDEVIAIVRECYERRRVETNRHGS